MTRRRRALIVVVSTLVALTFAEGALRLQQRLGPLVDLTRLAGREHFASATSTITHHRSNLGQDHVAIQTVPARCDAASRRVRVLFLGDSWVEEGGIVSGFAARVPPRPGVCLELLNAGVASWSPSPMLVEGLRLIDRHRPAMVVANIDETDVTDEFGRYRTHLVFDAGGRIERIGPDPFDRAVETHALGLLRAADSWPLFVGKFAAEAYVAVAVIPLSRAWKRVRPGAEPRYTYDVYLAAQLSPDPMTTDRESLGHFTRRFDEFVARIGMAIGSADRLLVTHHPHYLGVPALGTERRYNGVLAAILERECRRLGAGFYGAERDVLRLYGANFADYFEWPADEMSHLTHDGYLRYGAAIADQARARLDLLLD